MKKIIALLLALCMMFALVACGGGDDSGSGGSGSGGSSSSSGGSGSGGSDSGSGSGGSDSGSGSSGAADSQPSAEPTFDGEIVVGHLADLTGFEAMTGIEAKNAIDFAVNQVNAAGGVNGKKLVVIHGDSQCNAATAVEQARKLVQEDKVLCILGPTQASHKASVGDALEELGVPGIYYNGTSFGMTKFKKMIIGAGGSMFQVGTCMADYVYTDMGWRTVYVMGADNQGGKGYVQPFIGTFEALGGTVLNVDWIPEGQDFSPYFSTKSGNSADGIVAWFSGSEAQKFWINWYDAGLDQSLPVVGCMHGGFTDYFVMDGLKESGRSDVVDAMLETAIVPVPYHYAIDTPENKAFVEAWTAEFGSAPGATNLPGAAYGAVQLLKAACEAIDGELTSTALYETLPTINIKVPEGHLFFADGLRSATKDIYICKPVVAGDSYTYEVIKEYPEVPAETGFFVEGAVLELE